MSVPSRTISATPKGTKCSPTGTSPLLAKSAFVSSMMTGLRSAQRRLHQALGVGRIGRHADDQAGNVRPHRMITAAVVRAGAPERAGADAEDHRCVHLPVAHVVELRRLQHDLPRRLEHEVGEHQVGDGARAGGRGADRGAGKALFGDRRIDHARAAELLPEALGVREGAAALAGAFAEIEDVRVLAHLLGDAVADGVEPAGHDGRASGRGACCAARRIDRFREDMAPDSGRIRLRRVPGEVERVAHDVIDAPLDRGERGARQRPNSSPRRRRHVATGQRVAQASTSACVR